MAPCDRLLPLLSPDGTGHGKERHEPTPARVHGDVLDEERPGRADGDLQEADYTEWRQVTPQRTELFSLSLFLASCYILYSPNKDKHIL